MLSFLNKKPKIEFISHLSGLEKIMPITKAKPTDLDWFKKCMVDYTANKQEYYRPTQRKVSLNRCPGIFSVMGTGWVQRAWQDITIETNGDGSTFSWSTPTDQKIYGENHPNILDYVGSHYDHQQIYTNDFRNLKNIVKIQSPWSVNIPKGYSLLALPIPYPDHSNYESAIGILKGGDFPYNLSIQLRWYVKEGIHLIPAGTPLQQYILIKDEHVDIDVRAATEKDRNDLKTATMALHNSFSSKISNTLKVFR